jgi:hypothetical protein
MTYKTKKTLRWRFLRWLKGHPLLLLAVPSAVGAAVAIGCSSGDGSKNTGSAGSDSGGSSSGGTTSTGGQSSAGTVGTAGSPSGGATATGGVNAGGGSAGGPTIPGLDTCPQPPAACSDAAVIALNTENTVRLAMGLDCAGLVAELCASAQNHCDYYAANANTACEAASAHDEISGCPLYTGVSPGDRMRAAGYTGRGWSEVMMFRNDPATAVQGFIDTVYHRTPVLSPWYRDIGYGGAGDQRDTRCDTIDLSRGPTTSSDVTAFYPYANQTGIPLDFDGSREGPTPPEPPTGWPSGYPVTLYARGVTIVSHTITVDGSTADIPHIWEPTTDAYVLYTHAPLAPSTTYHVTIQTTRNAVPLDFDWRFTTGAN